MGKKRIPGSFVPTSKAVIRSLIALGILALAGGILEWYELTHPDEIAPISWAFWWMYEHFRPIASILGGVGGAFYSHFFWYQRPGDFWFPMTRNTVIVIGVATLGSMIFVQAWYLLAFMALFMGCAVVAHKYWFRVELFNEHLNQFHE